MAQQLWRVVGEVNVDTVAELDAVLAWLVDTYGSALGETRQSSLEKQLLYTLEFAADEYVAAVEARSAVRVQFGGYANLSFGE